MACWFVDNGYYLYGEVMPVIPPHNKDKQLLPVDSEDALMKDKNNDSGTILDNQAESSIWW